MRLSVLQVDDDLRLSFLCATGFIANRDRLDPYWLWLERISFMAYGYESLMRNELKGRCFSSDIPCPQLAPEQRTLVDGDIVLNRFGFTLSILICMLSLVGLMVALRLVSLLALYVQSSTRQCNDRINTTSKGSSASVPEAGGGTIGDGLSVYVPKESAADRVPSNASPINGVKPPLPDYHVQVTEL